MGEYDRMSKRDRLGLTPDLTTRWARKEMITICLFVPVGLQEFFYMP
jgi:hypothetical protein